MILQKLRDECRADHGYYFYTSDCLLSVNAEFEEIESDCCRKDLRWLFGLTVLSPFIYPTNTDCPQSIRHYDGSRYCHK